MKYLASIVFATLFVFTANAQTISEAEIEARAKNIGRSLRCVVCQNQSIQESDASLAQDMRKVVRSHIRAGESNQQVMDFMQERYGDFVLLKPPVQKNTYILWFGPPLLLLAALVWYVRRPKRKSEKPDPLTNEEQAAYDRLMSGENK